MPQRRFSTSLQAAIGELALRAITFHPGARRLHAVAVAHPDRRAVDLAGDAGEEVALVVDRDLGGAVLAVRGARDLAAGQEVQDVHPVADAEDRDADVEDGLVGERRALGVDARRAAREDDALGGELPDGVERDVEGVDLAVDVLLADAPRDQLRVLAAEVENEDHRGAPAAAASCGARRRLP